MTIIKNRWIFLVFVIVILVVYANIKPKCYNRIIFDAFDTVSELTVYSVFDNTAKYEDKLKQIDSELDIYNENSVTSRLNAGENVELSPDITALLTTSMSYTNILSDYFDISVNPLVEVWELAEKEGKLPNDIKTALDAVGLNGVYVDAENNYAQLINKNASITLGAVAKGYAANVIARDMRLDGVKSALINLGGNVYALGNKPDGGSWHVAVADPKSNGTALLTIDIFDSSVVTSGDYERYYEIAGKKYSHIINPKTGYPVETDIHSVTVIGKDSMLCDILSTAVYVAGKNEATSISEKFGVDIILIDDSTVYYTKGLDGKINMNRDGYLIRPLICENR